MCLSLIISVQFGESALQIAVRKGDLDVVKVFVQYYRDLHMESEVHQYYMDLADDYNHRHVVEYLSNEFPSLKRNVSHHSLFSHSPVTYRCLGHHMLNIVSKNVYIIYVDRC